MDKTPGQVGYEEMLAILREREKLPTVGPVNDSEEAKQAADYLSGVWAAQPQLLRDDWERVAAQILVAHLWKGTEDVRVQVAPASSWPPVRALVQAAQEARATLNAPCITCGCGTGTMGDDILAEALAPFRVASKN